MKKCISMFTLFLILFSVGVVGRKELAGENKTIENQAKGIWEGKKKLILKEVLSIGVKEGDENLIFNEPVDVGVDKEGNIYVLDKGNCTIKKFDKNGKFLQVIGRKGQGPGELLDSMDIEVDSKGSIWLCDIGNARISNFSKAGTFLSSFKLDFQAIHMAIDSENSVYVYGKHRGKLIHKYDSNGKYLISFMDEIQFEPKRIESHINLLGNIAIYKDKIYLAMIYPYTIFIFNKNGQ